MPRTKVSKSKRTRDDIVKNEKARMYEKSMEEFLADMDMLSTQGISNLSYKIELIKSSVTDTVLNMRFVDFLQMNLGHFRDYADALLDEKAKSRNGKKPSDDGYITEESTSSAASSSAFSTAMSMTQRGRTPGPLSSAIARQKSRRSQSASNDHSMLLAPPSSAQVKRTSSRTSRNKLRTPIPSRPKVMSADRSVMSIRTEKTFQSPQTAFLRWPKPGELIMSVHGTPLNAPVAPDKMANVNIPIKNGVISLRPKRLEALDQSMVNNFEDLEPETLDQIKTLHKNLEMIVKLSDRVGKKANNN